MANICHGKLDCVAVIAILVAVANPGQLYASAQDTLTPKGAECVTPVFTASFASSDLLEIAAEMGKLEHEKFELWLSELPALTNGVSGSPIALRKDTLTINDGKGIIYASPTNLRLIKSAGRVVVNYRILGDSSKVATNSIPVNR